MQMESIKNIRGGMSSQPQVNETRVAQPNGAGAKTNNDKVVREVKASSASAELNHDQGQALVDKLNQEFMSKGNKVRFQVNGPGSNHKVVVEVMNDKGEVVATLPNKSAQQLSQMNQEELAKAFDQGKPGLLVDSQAL